jgi:hypothetical protein
MNIFCVLPFCLFIHLSESKHPLRASNFSDVSPTDASDLMHIDVILSSFNIMHDHALPSPNIKY